jgi:hypothetical protein
MAQPKKHVRTLHDRIKIIEEVEKNPGEKHVDIAKRLGLKNYVKHMGLHGVWRKK